MKNLLKNRKFISVISVVLAVLIGGAVWYATTREKSVNLDRNAGLNPQDNTINLEVTPLMTRSISIDGNTKTVLGSIPKLYVHAAKNGNVTDNLPVIENSYYDYEDDEEIEPGSNSYDTNNYGSRDFINFEYQDKDITDLIKISPEIRGSWAANGGRELVFTPEKDWLPNQKYTITVNKDLISPELNLKDNKLNFQTPGNEINIQSLSLQKDVTQKKKFDIIGQIKSAYPLDEKDFTKKLTLTLDKKTLTPQITFDQFKRFAFIRYENVNILPKQQTVSLEVKYDKQTAKASTVIPEESKYFQIKHITATVQKNKDNVPEQLLVIEFSDSVTPKQLENKIDAYLVTKKTKKITQEVLNTAKKLELQAMPISEDGTVHSFKFDFNDEKSNYNIYVKVKPVILSESGFKLTKEITNTLKVPQYPKELTIMGDGSIIPLSGNKTVNFVSLGINKFDVELARIMPNQINHLVSQTYGNMKNPQFINQYNFNENNISELFKKKITLNADYKTPNYSSLDLKDYLKQGKGLFLITAKADYDTLVRRLIIISDIGVIYKQLENGTSKLYALSLAKEKPLASAKVEVLALNGTVIKTVYTNAEGVADIPNLYDFSNDKKPVAFLVKTDDDFTYIPFDSYDRKVNYSQFDVYGDSANTDLETFVWTDRGLYWPGEKVDFALIAKNKTWTTTAGLPIKVRITDPRGTKIFEKDISLTEEGLTALSYQLNKNANIGTYSIDTYSIDKDKQLDFISSSSFKVEEYEEDKLKVSSQIKDKKTKGWFLTKESLQINVNVQNLYGSPAQGNEVKASVRFIPTKFSFDDYKNYKFYDTLRNNNSLINEEKVPLSSQETDVEGNTTFDIDLNKYSKGTYIMRFNAEALEQESSKAVSTSVSAYISPLEYIVGYKTASNLSFLNKGSETTIDFIALNNNLEKIDLKDLTLVFQEQSYVSALTKQYDNVYRYQSVLQEKEISRQKININKTGTTVNLPTEAPGHYSAVLYNNSGEALNKIEYFVTGASNTSFNLEKDAILTMYLEKQSFEPGEEVTINLITPYAGIGLITLEGDKVYTSKWFKADTTSSIQTIKIPNTVVGGAYLNISFVRSLSSPEVYVSPYSYAVSYIKVTPSQRTLSIDLKTPELVRPGQNLKIQYKASAPAKIILFGSSEGILQVARYKTPNPLNYFFRKKTLEVDTFQIFDLFLPDLGLIKELSSVGGGYMADEAASFARFENEFKRNRLEPVTFWSKILQADTTARTYTYKVPDYFNGSIRVMAVAVNNQAVGSNSQNVKVKSPVILSASAPRMAAPGDTFDVGLRIANENDKLSKGNFSATINTSNGLKTIGDKTQNITISKGEEKTIYFKVQALEEFGNNDIKLEVKEKSLQETYTTSYSLSVRPASPYKATIAMGNVLNNKFTIKDFAMRDLYPYRAERTLELSQNPLVLFLSLETFLKNYPYGCTEQITSQIFPRLAHAAVKGKDAKKQVQEELDIVTSKLSLRQQDNGSFSMWDSGFGDDEITMYVADMLLTADEFGYTTPNVLLTGSMERVKNYVARIPYRDEQAKLMAYGHYLLARNGESQGSYLASLEKYFETHIPDYKKNIEGAYLAAAYKMLQDNDKAQSLIKSYETGDKYASYTDYDTTLTRNAKYLYLVAKYFPEKLNDKKNKEILKLMIRDIALNNYNTMSASYAMAALSKYAENSNSADTTFTVSCSKDNLKVTNGDISKVNEIPVNCKEFEISASKGAPLGNFWFLKQEGYDKQPAKKYSNGLEIYQEILNDKGEAVSKVKAGEDLTVKIKIKSLTGKQINNVAIVNMFAAPFMFIRGSMQGYYTFAEPMEDRLLIFGNYGPNTTTLTYKVKVTNAGEFIIPAVSAEAMYNSALSAGTDEGKLIVERR